MLWIVGRGYRAARRAQSRQGVRWKESSAGSRTGSALAAERSARARRKWRRHVHIVESSGCVRGEMSVNHQALRPAKGSGAGGRGMRIQRTRAGHLNLTKP